MEIPPLLKSYKIESKRKFYDETPGKFKSYIKTLSLSSSESDFFLSWKSDWNLQRCLTCGNVLVKFNFFNKVFRLVYNMKSDKTLRSVLRNFQLVR